MDRWPTPVLFHVKRQGPVRSSGPSTYPHAYRPLGQLSPSFPCNRHRQTFRLGRPARPGLISHGRRRQSYRPALEARSPPPGADKAEGRGPWHAEHGGRRHPPNPTGRSAREAPPLRLRPSGPAAIVDRAAPAPLERQASELVTGSDPRVDSQRAAHTAAGAPEDWRLHLPPVDQPKSSSPAFNQAVATPACPGAIHRWFCRAAW